MSAESYCHESEQRLQCELDVSEPR